MDLSVSGITLFSSANSLSRRALKLNVLFDIYSEHSKTEELGSGVRNKNEFNENIDKEKTRL